MLFNFSSLAPGVGLNATCRYTTSLWADETAKRQSNSTPRTIERLLSSQRYDPVKLAHMSIRLISFRHHFDSASAAAYCAANGAKHSFKLVQPLPP